MYAVDTWGVDIIVMPFGFEEGKDEIDSAIDEALYKGVLVFAAASDDGNNCLQNVAWPARKPDVICVHSCDGYGNPSSFTPQARLID